MGLTGRIAVTLTGADAVPPLTPDADEARRWAEAELADPVYAAAQPTPLDRVARAIGDFITDLFSADLPSGWNPVFAVIAAVVVAIVIVVAFFVFGRPRTAHRSRSATPDGLFGETERRSADQLRREAASRAAKGEWDAAIVLRFRALARALDERAVLDLSPGATVHAFARTAARAFPDEEPRLESAADLFDDVRYLRRPGTRLLYGDIVELDERLDARRPVSDALAATMAAP